MTKEEKQILILDLCARLPYGVCVHVRYKEGEPCYGKLTPRDIQWFIDSNIEVIKPYLRPMSSMTEEEAEEFRLDFHYYFYIGSGYSLNNKDGSYMMPMFVMRDYFDWLNKNHFDYRGLIEKGLALKATDGMYI